jgi:hypothetical protein
VQINVKARVGFKLKNNDAQNDLSPLVSQKHQDNDRYKERFSYPWKNIVSMVKDEINSFHGKS